MESEKRLYQAIIWKQDSKQPGERTSVLAFSLEDAERQLTEKYGTGIAFSLYNEEDSDQAR